MNSIRIVGFLTYRATILFQKGLTNEQHGYASGNGSFAGAEISRLSCIGDVHAELVGAIVKHLCMRTGKTLYTWN
jgi:hypothetical protein